MHTQYAKIMIIIACSLMFYYVIQRFFTIFDSHSPKQIAIVVAIIIAGISGLSILYSGTSKIIDIIGTISSWIFVLCFLLFILLTIENIISIRYKINPRIIIGIIIILLGLGLFFSLKTKTITIDIPSDKISKDTKILLVSDIHVDHIFSTYHIRTIQNAIKKYNVDFVLIAGDLLNKPNPDYIQSYSSFSGNEYPPIFAVAGNHDSMWSPNTVQKIQDISNIKILNNETIQINGIQIIGIVDKSTWGNKTLDDIMGATNMNNGDGSFSILITHQPIGLEKLEKYPIDLEVAGHTHRGQFFGLRKIVEKMNDYGYGKYEEYGKTAIVTQGIGTWGLPFRLGTQSEIVIINLKKN